MTADNLEGYLGRKQIHREGRLEEADPGVAHGLAWTRRRRDSLY